MEDEEHQAKEVKVSNKESLNEVEVLVGWFNAREQDLFPHFLSAVSVSFFLSQPFPKTFNQQV